MALSLPPYLFGIQILASQIGQPPDRLIILARCPPLEYDGASQKNIGLHDYTWVHQDLTSTGGWMCFFLMGRITVLCCSRLRKHIYSVAKAKAINMVLVHSGHPLPAMV